MTNLIYIVILGFCTLFTSSNVFASPPAAPLSSRATIEIGYARVDVASRTIKTTELCSKTIDFAKSPYSSNGMSVSLECASTLNGTPVQVTVRVMSSENLVTRKFNGQDVFLRTYVPYLVVEPAAGGETTLQHASTKLLTQQLSGGGYVVDLQPRQWLTQMQCLSRAQSPAEVQSCADAGEAFVAAVYIQEN